MKRFLFAALVAAGGLTSTAQAADWMFMPSYYSHDPVKAVRVQRQYSNGPIYTPSYGQYVNSGYRFLHSSINVGGGTFDQINMWDSWYQAGAKLPGR